jgi:hypothetical protein
MRYKSCAHLGVMLFIDRSTMTSDVEEAIALEIAAIPSS